MLNKHKISPICTFLDFRFIRTFIKANTNLLFTTLKFVKFVLLPAKEREKTQKTNSEHFALFYFFGEQNNFPKISSSGLQ